MAHNFLRSLFRLRPLCVAAGCFYHRSALLLSSQAGLFRGAGSTRLRSVLQSIVKKEATRMAD